MKPDLRTRQTLVCTFALCTLLLAPLRAPAQPLADRLPADTLVYVGWAGADALGSQYDASHLKAVLEASSVPKLVDEYLPQLVRRIQQQEPQAREALAGLPSLGQLWHKPCAFAFTGLDMKGDPDGPPLPRALFVCRPGDDAASLKRQFDAVVRQIQQGAGPGGPPVRSFRSGDLVGVSFGYDQPEAALVGGAAPGAGARGQSLAASAAFKSALARAGREPAVVAYVDAAAVVQQVNQVVEKSGDVQMSEHWPRVRDALGLDGFKRLVFTQGFDGKDWGTQVFVEAPAPRKGILAMLDGAPLGDDILKAVPATSTVAGVTRFDLARLFDEVRGAMQKVDPDAARQFDQVVQQGSQALDMDLRRDLLAALGDEWAYYTDPMTGGRGAAGLVLVNRLRDRAKAEQSLNKLAEMANTLTTQRAAHAVSVRFGVRETKAGDVTVRFVPTPLFTPSWSVHGGNLYVGLYPQVVASAASRAARGGKGLADNPQFQQLRQRLLAGAGNNARPSSVSFMDLPQTAPGSYQTWLMITSLIRFGDLAGGVESPAMVFPTMDVLMQHLSPAASVSWTDERGWHLRGVSPFPGSTVLGADTAGMMNMQTTALMASIMLPSLNRAREQANRVKSASNLRQIGMGVMMFANENKGKFPQDIGQLPATQDLTADVFVNPRTSTPPPPPDARTGEKAVEWVRENSDYVYVGAGKDYRADSGVIVAYEKPEGLSDGINVLFADGHVEFLPMPQAMEAIRAGRLGEAPDQRPPLRRPDRFQPRPPGQRPAPPRQPGGGL